ncbi:hypothetical protein AB836_01285 [Rickettsiales bacterium (ex Bugula neritina AB1)]|nr:hypothetical protein AB836_01285 [Rickettsiales bacterium (ex Bugula neritina AB1)]
MSKRIFSILLPPPNVSGSLHLGHSLDAFIEDFFGKIAKLNNYTTILLPGYDHGGISTEYSALKNNKDKLSKDEKYKIINQFANNSKEKIDEQMKLLKIDVDEEKTMYTMDENHKNFVMDSFIKLYNKGLIYEKEKVVFWDPYFQTTLSDLEVIQKEVDDYIYYIKYKIKNSTEYISIATTRPETIFADVALAVNKKYKNLVGKHVLIPIINREIPIIYHKDVDDNFGTGILKLTPTYDETDFNICEEYNFSKIHIFNEKLKAINVPENYKNLNIQEVKIKILEELKKINQLEKIEDYKRKLFIGEKSQKPIETILRNQWYLDLNTAEAIKAVKEDKLKFFPSYWKNTYLNWLEGLNPWCISRENIWGHKMPIFRRKNNEVILAKTKEEALKQFPNEEIYEENFILDTWFSSALWPLSFGSKTGIFPTTTLVTAYDIIFFWVARMVLMTTNLTNELPFKNVFIHQLVRDEKGYKMSKTLNNVINPLDIIKEWSVDILRYNLLSKVYVSGNIKFSIHDLENTKKNINKLKNAIKFIEINYGFEIDNKNIHIDDEISIYFLNKFKKIENLERVLLDNYNIHKYIEELEDFFFKEYCDWLIEFSKVHKNLQIKYTLLFILERLLKLFYPLIPEFVEQNYTKIFKKNLFDKEYFNISIKKIDISYIDILIKIIKIMRSFKNNLKINVWLSPNIRYKHILEFMKINISEEEGKFLKIYDIKIYCKDINNENLLLYFNKQKNKLSLLENKLYKQTPPEDIKNKIELEIYSLKEEINNIKEIIT